MPDNISFVNEMLTHPHDFLRFSPDAVIIVNREHKIIETNEQAQNLFGYSQEEFLSLSINKLLTPDVAKRHNELQNEYFINPRIRGLGERQGVEGVDKQGAILDLDIKLVPYDIDGQRFAMAVVRDVRNHVELRKEVQKKSQELHELNEKLQSHNHRLLELNKLKNEFLGIAAHDLRSPIASVIGNIEFLLETTKPESSADEIHTMNDVLYAANYMLSVINEFLDVSTLESGSITLNPQACDLKSLLQHSVSAMALQAKRKNIRVSLDIDPNLPNFMVDTNRIKQVVDNYLSNALKYSYKNSNVYISAHINDTQFILSIKDEGQGIEEKFVGQLFQPFKQTSAVPTDGESSTGLGLYIIKSIVEKHGGKAWFESEVNKGSTFYFSLPSNLVIKEKVPAENHA